MKHWHETAAILDRVARIAESGAQAAIATVVRISGSAYRRPGAKLFVEENGTTRGGVSGGCLEADVRAVALEILRGAPAKLLHYDTGSDEETVWGLGLGCEGAIDLWVQRADARLCAEMGALVASGVPYAIVTLLSSGRAALFARGTLLGSLGAASLDRALADRAAQLLEQAESRLVEIGPETAFIDVLRPPPRLAIFGAGDDAQPLAQLAAQAGFSVTVIDHRPAYLTAERFPPPAQLVLRRASDGVLGLSLGRRHFAVVQTHALIHDRDWLKALLPLSIAYLGLLGPRARKEEVLRQLGVDDVDKLYAPVGIDLGADGPEQVAISIVAEMLAVHAGRAPGHLRARRRGIHERGDPVAGVLLAAGTSSRMGRNKLYLELGGKSVLRRAVDAAAAAGLDPILVVLGHEPERAQAELKGLDGPTVRTVLNPDYAGGIDTSMRAGIAAVPESAGGAVVLLADMPFVSAAMIRELVERWRAADAPLAVSRYGEVLAPPMLYGRSLFPELLALDGAGCGKRVVKRHRDEALEVAWPASALADLDFPEDVDRVRAQIEGA